ncbi:unnamed protein product [Brassica oleracea var. botrytis]
MNATVTEAERFSANTYFFISTLLRNAEDERPNLQMCAEAFAIVNTMFRNATYFIAPGYETNPMIEKNRETMVLMAMQKIVVHMILFSLSFFFVGQLFYYLFVMDLICKPTGQAVD